MRIFIISIKNSLSYHRSLLWIWNTNRAEARVLDEPILHMEDNYENSYSGNCSFRCYNNV